MKIVIIAETDSVYQNLHTAFWDAVPASFPELQLQRGYPEELLISRERPELLLLSLGAFEKNLGLAEYLWRNHPDQKIILAAGHPEDIFPALSHPFYHIVRLYLLKPDMDAVIKKLSAEYLRRPSGVLFSSGKRLLQQAVEEILFLESQGHTILLHCRDGTEELTDTLSDCEEKLRKWRFLRIHKSYLVNPYYIRVLRRDSLILENGQQLYISRYRYPEVKLQFEQYIRHLDWMK